MHQLSNIKPINILLHERAKNTKFTLQHIIQDTTYTQITTENINNNSQHSWFRTTAKVLEQIPPQPIYT